MSGPHATAAFLLVSGLLFAALLVTLGWRAGTPGFAAWMTVAAVIVAVAVIVIAFIFSRDVREGRL